MNGDSTICKEDGWRAVAMALKESHDIPPASPDFKRRCLHAALDSLPRHEGTERTAARDNARRWWRVAAAVAALIGGAALAAAGTRAILSRTANNKDTDAATSTGLEPTIPDGDKEQSALLDSDKEQSTSTSRLQSAADASTPPFPHSSTHPLSPTTSGDTMSLKNTSAAMLAAAAVATSATLQTTALATTLTWVGGTSGLMSSASNWSPQAVPQPGDTCVFHSAATLEAEDFDLGSGGLTLENDATLTVLTHFAGSGGITKRGSAALAVKNTTAGTFSGDVTIEAGRLSLASGGAIRFGQGKIVFTQASASGDLITQGDHYSQNLQNDVEFRGESSNYAIYLCRNATVSGTISSLHDFRIGIAYLGLTVSGDINAPGCTLTIEFPQSWNSCECNLSGSINASLVKKHSKDTTLSGRSDYIDNTLRVEGGNLIVANAGYWGGTNVQVTGSSSVLRLRGSQNLSTLAAVQVEDGGKLNLDSTCAVTVSKLIVDGAAQRSGTYSASNLPNSITGSGTIIVSPKTWVGGASGYLSAAGNWSDGLAPQPGDVLMFSNPVELLNETVNLGAEGYTLASSHVISNHVWFTGAGGIVKRGSGTFIQFGDAGGDFAGGARFEGCQLHLANRYLPGTSNPGRKFFGTGMVALDGNDARISTKEWACGLTNAIAISNSFIPTWDTGSVIIDQGNVVIGPVTASSDFRLIVRNYGVNIASIDAPGRTVMLDTYWGSGNTYASGHILDGPVNANVTTAGNRSILFNGSSPNPDHTLRLTSCTNTLSAAAYWGGTNVVVTGAGTRLVLKAAGNLSEAAHISVTSGGRIDIASGVKVRVAGLSVDGVEMGSGIYTSGNLPGVILGGGRIKIGDAATVIIIR